MNPPPEAEFLRLRNFSDFYGTLLWKTTLELARNHSGRSCRRSPANFWQGIFKSVAAPPPFDKTAKQRAHTSNPHAL